MSDARIIEIFVEEATELIRRASVAAARLEGAEPPERAELHATVLRDLHTLKGSAGLVELPAGDAVAECAHHLEDLILATGGPDGAVSVMGEVLEGFDAMEILVMQVASGDFEAPPPPGPMDQGYAVEGIEGFFLFEEEGAGSVPPSAPAPRARPAQAKQPPKPKPRKAANRELLRIRPERIDAAHEVVSELIVSRLQGNAQTAQIVALRDRLVQANLTFRAVHGQLREHRQELGPLWREVEGTLERLHNELSELRKCAGGLARRSTSLRDRTGALVGAMEDAIRTLRVMPTEPFLEELFPVVREAAKVVGRSARLVIDGGGAEADRHVLVGLREPLLHLVRNAVAHGIGSPERRTADGRPAQGTVFVKARCQGSRLRISIQDDGFGIDVDSVAEKGVELGLVTPGATPDNKTLLSILTQPGFSTTERADALSGRGVGMDVVNNAIDRLGGWLELEPNPGTGACFIIDVPIAAATTKGLVVVCGDTRFGLPLGHIERVVRLQADDLQGQEHPFAHIEGEPVAVAPLGLFVEEEISPLGEVRRPAVVLHAHGVRLALLVDDVPGESDLVIKPMPPAFANHPLVNGGAVQADSSVLLVLDLPGLVHQVQRCGVPPWRPPCIASSAHTHAGVP